MSALLVLLGVAMLLALAYRWYGRWLATRVFPLDDSEPTPAHTLRDGRDFVPAPPLVVFGHHFASIAGLGPLLGPAIAVIWGWVPALLWIVLGCIFVGAVHDLGCMYSSLRNRARSVADLAYDVAGARARALFLLFGIFALALAMGVFVINIANLFAPGAGGAERGMYPKRSCPARHLSPLRWWSACCFTATAYRWQSSRCPRCWRACCAYGWACSTQLRACSGWS
jgi:carbon starvation protein